MSLLIQARVAYESDLERVEDVVIEVGREVMSEVEGGVEDAEILVRFHTFAESGIGFTAILRTGSSATSSGSSTSSSSGCNCRFAKEGIRVPYPRREIILPGGGEPSDLISG